MSKHVLLRIMVLVLFGKASADPSIISVGKFHPEESGDGRLWVLQKPSGIRLESTVVPLPAAHVGSVLASALGYSSYEHYPWPGIQLLNPFHAPQASASIFIDGLDPDITMAFSSVESFDIQQSHTIPAPQFFSVRPGESIARHVVSISPGGTFALTAAASEGVAKYLDLLEAADSLRWRYSTKMSSWEDSSSGKSILSKSEVIAMLSANLLEGVSVATEVVLVQHQGQVHSYSLEDQAVLRFFSEAVLLTTFSSLLRTFKPESETPTKDIFTFYMSLKELAVSQPIDHVRPLVIVLSRSIDAFSSKMSQLYNNNILIDVITRTMLGKHIMTQTLVLNSIQNSSKVQVLFPLVFSDGSLGPEDISSLCKTIGASLPESMQFVCSREEPAIHLPGKRLLASSENSSLNIYDFYDSDYSSVFNIWVFLAIAIALTVYAVAVTLWNMDPGTDGIVYRQSTQRMKID